MQLTSALPSRTDRMTRAALRSITSWWFMLHFMAMLLVLSISRKPYGRDRRTVLATCIHSSTWQVLPWFCTLSALLSLVLIRILMVTALSYGLSRYALEMVVRVLVIELIPLGAALFVALRAESALSLPAISDATATRPPLRGQPGLQQLQEDWVPRLLATAFSVLALAIISSVTTLVLAYVTVYGFSPWGLPAFTRTVGQLFDPLASLGFTLKTTLFALTVAAVPLAASAQAMQQAGSTIPLQNGSVRLFALLFLIEAVSLLVKYL
jgi:phospholipid/cholesterol/gamma-HCH transport system permease protein